MLAQPEVIIFFLAKFYFPPLRREFPVRTALFISQKLFLANRVITSLFILIDLFFVPKPFQHSLHTFLVQRIGRRRPGVITYIQFVPQRNELLCHSGNVLPRRTTLFLG